VRETRTFGLGECLDALCDVDADAEEWDTRAADEVGDGAVVYLDVARDDQPPSSYLNDTLTLALYADTLPFSIETSSSETSATRRSRSDCDAVVTALDTACSQDSVLVPTSSMTL
jgi:hypothetical protein